MVGRNDGISSVCSRTISGKSRNPPPRTENRAENRLLLSLDGKIMMLDFEQTGRDVREETRASMGTSPAKLHTSRTQTSTKSRRKRTPRKDALTGSGREQETSRGDQETFLPGLPTLHP